MGMSLQLFKNPEPVAELGLDLGAIRRDYAEIAEALEKKAGIKLDKRKLVLNETIKNVGTYTVTCKLGYEITAPLTVKIEEA